MTYKLRIKFNTSFSEIYFLKPKDIYSKKTKEHFVNHIIIIVSEINITPNIFNSSPIRIFLEFINSIYSIHI